MIESYNNERVVAIHKMLFEMARGNFNGRIPLSTHDDALETLVVLINMVAEEMKESIFLIGYVNPHRGQRLISHMAIIMDTFGTIKSATPNVLSFLGFSEADLLEQPARLLPGDPLTVNKGDLVRLGVDPDLRTGGPL